jgi:catechol 2,3-dioxygenase-like lactoylglutathione lyase family enzyme
MDDRFPRAVIDTEELDSPHMKALRSISTPGDMPFGITKIGHVVLRVRDVQKSAEFYTKVLGFRISDVYPDSMMPGNMVFLRLNSDHHGVALVGGNDRDATSSEMHHMAFQVETLDEVFRARDHLNKTGVKIEFEGRRRAGCQVAVEFHDPDGHFLEIFWGLDQMGPHDVARPPEEWRPVASLEDAIDHAPPGQNMTLKDPSLRK